MQTSVLTNTDTDIDYVPLQSQSTTQMQTHNEKFYNRSLEALRGNEMDIKQYWSKPVQVTVNKNTVIFRGQFSCCDDSGWITFNEVLYEKHPEPQFLEGMMNFTMWHISAICDIILIDEPDSKEKEETKSCKLGKSIANMVFDVLRLKLVRKALFKMSPQYLDLRPLDIVFRKLYFKSSTKASIKQQIGDNIVNIKIPQNLTVNPLFSSLFTAAITDSDRIRRGRCNYNLHDALSLLNDYHTLWIQHIKQHTVVTDSDEKETTAIQCKFNKSYMDWDNYELNAVPLISAPLYWDNYFGGFVYGSSHWNSELPEQIQFGAVATDPKAKNVYIESIWPHYFVGPVTKSKKKHPDWLCMKCLKESTVPSLRCEESKEKIYFYKSNRTDMKMEICRLCVETCLAAQGWARFAQKQTKASKRYYKRLKNKLDDYNEKGIPWTPPTVLAGQRHYGICEALPYTTFPPYMPGPGMNQPIPTRPAAKYRYGPRTTKPGVRGVRGPTFSLPYPTLPPYMPGLGMNQPIPTKPGVRGPLLGVNRYCN